MNNVLYYRRIFLATALSLLGIHAAFGEFQWSSYDTSGNLVTANVASGGSLAGGSTVTFTIPANTQLFFVTKDFRPFSMAGPAVRKFVTFKVSASGGLTGVAQRTMGWGLYNSANTAGFSDDIGYFGLWNGSGAKVETYVHRTPTDGNNLFTGTNPGEGNTQSGTMADNVTYTNQIQLYMNPAQTGIALGSSSSTLGTCGIAVNGPSMFARGYTNPYTPLLGGTTTFDQFAFMFNNTTASAVTVTVSAIGLGDSLTWDASGTNPTFPTDGSGNWSTSSNYWSSGVGGAIGAGDSAWTSGYNAVIGATNGAAGTITISDPTGVTVSDLTFNPPGSGSYTIAGNSLTLTNNSKVTVASGVSATISAIIGGNSGLTKEGSGALLLNESANNTYTGDTIVNNGVVQPGSTAGQSYIPGNLIINTNGTFVAVSGGVGSGVFGTATLVLNGRNPGGSNVFVNSGARISAGICVLANGAVITNANGGTSGTYAATNTDARSGQVWLTRHGFGVFNTIAKSTAGNVIISSRPNASATDGYIATLNAGALVFDYAYAANAAVKLKANSPLMFAGGTLVFSNANSTLNPSANNPGTGGTFFNSGASSLASFNAGASGGNLTMGTITRKAGATFNLVKPVGPGSIGSSGTANVNGIVGGWNTFDLTDWTAGTSTWAALAAANYTTSTDPTTWAAANNVSLSASTSPNVPNATSINSLRLTNTATVTLDGSLTLTSGGLLVIGNGATAITGGTLLGASGVDLIVHQNASADLTISSTLADNGSATSLTKDGAGKLVITGVNTMTGTNFLNGGVVEVSDLAKLASGPLDMNGGTLRYTGTATTSSRGIVTRGLGPTIDIAGGTTVTQSGAIVGSGDVLGDFGGLTKTGNGTLILSATNYYNGETVVSGGVLAINGTNAYDKTVWDAGKISVIGGTLGGNGLISGLVNVKNGGTIAPGTSIGTLTLGANLTLESGSTSLFEVTNSAAGDLLVVQGNLTIEPNATIAISVLGAALEPMTNTLITYTGTKSGSFNPVVAVTGSLNGSVTLDESTPGQIKLVIGPQVAIIGQPQDTIVSENADATFAVTATGSAPISYQWYSFGNDANNTPNAITDATNSVLTITNAQSTNTGYYGVVVSNSNNSVASRAAFLIVGNVLPVLSGPGNKTAIQGNDVTFNVSVLLANPPADLQWRTNGTDVPGATGSSVTFHNVQYDMNGTTVSVVATNLAGSVTNSATLTVIVTPVISPQPTDLTVNVGDPASFVSGATGVPTPALQWYKNGALLSGQTSGTLSIASAQGSDVGFYALVATNVAGSVTSAPVKLTVVSTALSSTTLSPANGATGICYDTPLYVTFNGPVSIVNSGRIQIFNVNGSTPVDTIYMNSNRVFVAVGTTNNVQPHSLFSGDAQAMDYYPVIITGNTAAIYPHLGVLTSNQTYYVVMDSGIVTDSNGAYFAGISDTNAWKFTTKIGGPANPTNIVVAADGSGDFVTVQGAVDSIPSGNNTFTVVNIRNGNYVEIVDISGKNNISFLGQSRKGAIVGYPNNNNLTGTTAGRMAFKVNGADISLVNLTITNGTVQGGSQAEALLVYNSGVRCVVNNCDILSRQDTILVNATASQGYFQNCYVAGNFDYIWGSGAGFFTNCVFHTLTNTLSGSYNLTAARTGTGVSSNSVTPWVNPNGTTYSAYGFSFVNCTFEADAGVSNVTLAGSNGTSGGLDSWANCKFSSAYVTPPVALSNSYVFWQYNNTDLNGNPVSFGTVQTIGPTVSDPRLAATLSSVVWFSGWNAVVPNNNPATSASSYSRPSGFSLKIAIVGDLATHWSDPDADPLTLTGAISSTNGATVSYDSSYVYYSNPNNVADEIDYTISDGRGGLANGVINVTIVAGNVGGIAQSISTDGSAVAVNFSGIPNYRYDIERATDVNFTANLTVLITTNAPANGQFQFTDNNPPQPTAFYRLKYNP